VRGKILLKCWAVMPLNGVGISEQPQDLCANALPCYNPTFRELSMPS